MNKFKVLFLLFIISLLLLHCGGKTGKTTKTKIYFVGIDGADWDIIDPLIEKGKLEFFAKLKKESSWARLKTFKPTLSPVVWTCIATGKNKDKSGISGWSGGEYSNAQRKEPSIWEINDFYKEKSTIINWFVTYPPDKINGILVSDKFKLALYQFLFTKKGKMNNLKSTVYPEDYGYKLFHYLKEDYKKNRLEYKNIIDEMNIPDYLQIYKERYGENYKNVPILKIWEKFVFYNYVAEKVTENLLKTTNSNLFMTYFRMPDVFKHFGTLYLEKDYCNYINKKMAEYKEKGKRLPKKDREEFELKFSDVVYPILKHKEKIIKKIYSKAKKENAYLFISSDHGFKLWEDNYTHTGLPKGISAPDGILMILGPGVKKSQIEANIYDITPTILYLMRKPIGKNMDGSPLVEAFDFKNNIQYKTYKKRKTVKEQSKPEFNKKEKEELESLGYI